MEYVATTGNRQQATIPSLPIDDELSKRIKSLRFILIVFVIIIHNGISAKIFSERNIPDYVLNVQRLIGVITSIAVPLFFMFSAYFLYIKEQKYFSVLKKKCRTILLPYILWHILLIGFYFAVSILPFTKQYFSPEKFVSSWELLDWIKAFCGDYSNTDNVLKNTPFVYQFWFLRDLFILTVLFAGIKKLVDKFPFGTFVFCLVLWVNNIRIYIVSPEALLFFMLGYYVIKYNLSMKNIDMIKTFELLTVYCITIIMEYFFIKTMPVLSKINIIIGCLFFLKISRCFIENVKLYNVLAWLEKYQFIVYAVHGVMIPQFLKIYIRIIPPHGVYILLGYFLMILFGVFISLFIGILLKKLFPKIYRVLTGGRI
ncbi:MAG: acyltransferase [Dysgonamonadaceae bacterium]|jgi:fucose 4-O-acetylase-like acetyltransferase|nr:acyltransferase [Dysgonamonadaceae bacterium]